jgi:hypothetical protein
MKFRHAMPDLHGFGRHERWVDGAWKTSGSAAAHAGPRKENIRLSRGVSGFIAGAELRRTEDGGVGAHRDAPPADLGTAEVSPGGRDEPDPRLPAGPVLVVGEEHRLASLCYAPAIAAGT